MWPVDNMRHGLYSDVWLDWNLTYLEDRTFFPWLTSLAIWSYVLGPLLGAAEVHLHFTIFHINSEHKMCCLEIQSGLLTPPVNDQNNLQVNAWLNWYWISMWLTQMFTKAYIYIFNFSVQLVFRLSSLNSTWPCSPSWWLRGAAVDGSSDPPVLMRTEGLPVWGASASCCAQCKREMLNCESLK